MDGAMTVSVKCPACKGSKKYVGLNETSDCPTCGGSGVDPEASVEAFDLVWWLDPEKLDDVQAWRERCEWPTLDETRTFVLADTVSGDVASGREVLIGSHRRPIQQERIGCSVLATLAPPPQATLVNVNDPADWADVAPFVTPELLDVQRGLCAQLPRFDSWLLRLKDDPGQATAELAALGRTTEQTP
jgi:hypothetical protein